MTDPNLQGPIDTRAAGRPAHAAGPPPGDDPFAAFGSEQEARDIPGPWRGGSTGLDSADLADWSQENALSLFAAEAPSPPVPIVRDVQSAAAFPAERAVTSSQARAERRIFPVPVMLSVLALVVVGGAVAAGALLMSGGQGGERIDAETSVAAPAQSSVTTLAPRVGELPLLADEPLIEPVGPAADADLTPLMNAKPAAAPDPLRATNVERGAAPGTEPATSQPPVLTAAAEPPPPALAPPEALPGITARTINPTITATRGAVAVPEIIATVGTLPPAPAPNVAPPTGSSSAVAETAAIESVLSRYAAAFTARDVVAAKAVWPGVNERGLLKAFESVEEQQFDLGACVITANPAQAVAVCNGTARYVPKVGGKRVRSEPRHWTFRLEQRAGDWSIETVDFR